MTENNADLAELLKTAIKHHEPQLYAADENLPLDGPAFVLAPDGMKPINLKPFQDEYRERPLRAKGIIRTADPASLITVSKRFCNENAGAVLFCTLDERAPKLQAIFNYHESQACAPGLVPGFGDHRAVYEFPLSEAWEAWAALDGAKVDQITFAAFLEDRIMDVIPPPPIFTGAAPDHTTSIGSDSAAPPLAPGGDFGPRSADEELARMLHLLGGRIAGPNTMLELSRGLELTATMVMKEKRNLGSGEDVFAFEEVHSDGSGKPVKVPQLFLIEIPVFEGGERHQIAVRLRYRLAGGKVTWFFQRARVKETFDLAIRTVAAKAQAETGLPLFFGQPET
jgi:uncharacterized protein YfdQ (DUF2303 family)